MGAESFFFKFLPYGVEPVHRAGALTFTGHSRLRARAFRTALLHLPLEVRQLDNWYGERLAVENILLLEYGEQDGWLQEITIVGCLGWYLESLRVVFHLTNLINTAILPIGVYYPGKSVLYPDNEAAFMDYVRPVYDKKWEEFKNIFDGFHDPILPSHFYQEWKKRQTWWWKWAAYLQRRKKRSEL